MKERPILFKGQMVKAILEERKTQTRRLIEPQPKQCPHNDDAWIWSPHHTRLEALLRLIEQKCKHGQTGDRLWVRETWVEAGDDDPCDALYRSNGEDSRVKRWKPSIHMPRWASRITLEITGVRVERLQGISKSDVLAEGTPGFELEKGSEDECRACYKQLWETINGKGSWDKNPWVWVIEFRRITP